MNSKALNAVVTPDALYAALSFLPRLEKIIPENIWLRELEVSAEGNTITIERGEYNPIVIQFQQALYDLGFVFDFDWPAWQPRAARIFANPDLLKRARMGTCIKLLTLHVRKERFCDGHLAEMLRTGHITAVLRRMAELAQ